MTAFNFLSLLCLIFFQSPLGDVLVVRWNLSYHSAIKIFWCLLSTRSHLGFLISLRNQIPRENVLYQLSLEELVT